MTKSALLASTAIALILCVAPATAQMQQKEESAPNAQQKAEPRDKDAAPGKPEQRGNAQAEPKDTPPKGNAQKSDPQGKATKGTAEKTEPSKSKGTAEKSTEPKGKSTKGTAEKAPQPQDKATKGAAGNEPRDKGTAGTSTQPKDKAAGAEPKDKSGSSSRVQLSEQQRTNVHQTVLKDRNVNRVTNLSISINVGTRVPRSVRLVALPASVFAVVPEYRSYRYFVVDDRICIVEPNTYEIVEVITVSGQTAVREDRGGQAKLVLTDEERMIILREVDMRGGSTLALGALTEGADVPREIEIREFPATVVEKVPKVKGFKFFTAENRLAIVDSRGTKVQLVVEDRR